MVFKKRAENNGEIDPRINVQGRVRNPNGEKILTKRAVRDKELLSLLRKIKPHLSDSIMTAAKIMKNEDASHMSQLKAATILLNAYKELINDAYNGEDPEEEATDVQPNTPVFSLKMINTDRVEKVG